MHLVELLMENNRLFKSSPFCCSCIIDKPIVVSVKWPMSWAQLTASLSNGHLITKFQPLKPGDKNNSVAWHCGLWAFECLHMGKHSRKGGTALGTCHSTCIQTRKEPEVVLRLSTTRVVTLQVERAVISLYMNSQLLRGFQCIDWKTEEEGSRCFYTFNERCLEAKGRLNGILFESIIDKGLLFSLTSEENRFPR